MEFSYAVATALYPVPDALDLSVALRFLEERIALTAV